MKDWGTTALDVVGVGCVVAFAAIMWPPAVLLVLSVVAFLASWSLQRGDG